MFYQPGHGDVSLAEFQAKLLTNGQPPYPDPAEERLRRITRVIWRWVVIALLVAAILGWIFDVNVAAAGSLAVLFVGVLVAWLNDRRRKARLASLSDQP